jgi:hypothetical protein
MLASRPREGLDVNLRWLLLAATAHGLLIALLSLVPVHRILVEPRGQEPHAELEIEAIVEPAQVPALREREPAPAALAHRDREPVRPATLPQVSAPSELPSTAEASPEPEAQVPKDVTQPPRLSAEALGLAGRNVFLGQLPSASARHREPEQAPENMAPGIEQSVRQAVVEDDLRRGLSASGPIVSLAEQLVRSSDTPVNSDARLEISVGASGTVSAVLVAAASEGFSDWERVAADLQKALRGRSLHVPRGASGLAIALEVTSREQRPSGHDTDTQVSLFGVPVNKASPRSKHPNSIEVLKPGVKTVDVVQPPELLPPVKLPPKQRVVGATVVGLGFDPADLGAHGQRVVHVRILHEKAL